MSDFPPSYQCSLYFAGAKLCRPVLVLYFDFIRLRTPLHLSALYGRSETCRLLLQSNADIEAKDYE
jgi:ankyrin repeat protein